MKFNNILVPIDFSDHSLNALEWGCEIAEKSDAKLHIIHAYEYDSEYVRKNAITFVKSFADDILKKLYHDLKRLEVRFPKLARLKPRYEVSFDFILKAITDYAKNNDVDLVVMGTQGRNNVNNQLIGSVTWALINHITIPVLAIPSNYTPQEISSVVVADDFELVSSDKMFREVAYVANLYHAPVKILHVSKVKEGVAVKTDEVLNIAKAFKDIPHSYTFYENKSADQGILEFVKKHNTGMLVIFPQKRGYFTSLFKKSITDYVVHRINIPLLALKP